MQEMNVVIFHLGRHLIMCSFPEKVKKKIRICFLKSEWENKSLENRIAHISKVSQVFWMAADVVKNKK